MTLYGLVGGLPTEEWVVFAYYPEDGAAISSEMFLTMCYTTEFHTR
jgi:hypothetical protein